MFICEIALWAMAFFECRETDCHSPSGFAMTVFFVTCRIKIGAETIETHIIARSAATWQSHIPFCRAVISMRCRGRRPRRPACNVTNSPKCALKRNILPPGRRRRRPLQPISNRPINWNFMLYCLKPIILIGIYHIKADKLCQYARLEKGVTIDSFKV